MGDTLPPIPRAHWIPVDRINQMTYRIGFEDGQSGRPHNAPPEHATSYGCGYEAGMDVRRKAWNAITGMIEASRPELV